jgi:predicted acetyltransferase
MARKRYDVVFKLSQWQVTYASQTISTHLAKSTAIDVGVAVARRNEPSQLVIHRADGTIEDERTYGDDPYPPRG